MQTPLAPNYLASKYMPQWVCIDPLYLQSAKMTGITNQTYRVSHNQSAVDPQNIIVRIFSKDMDDVFISLYKQSARSKLGPEVYYCNKRFRLEQYFENDPVTTYDMNQPETRRLVALKLQTFHNSFQNLPDNRMLLQRLFNNRFAIRKVREHVQGAIDGGKKSELCQKLLSFIDDPELRFVKSVCPDAGELTAVCHNDLLCNNILKIDQGSDVALIDYEYSSQNYVAYDIANYFNECQIDYSSSQPPYYTILPPTDQKDILDFVQYYCFGKHFCGDYNKTKLVQDPEYFMELTKNIKDKYYDDINQIMQTIPVCRMLSNYFWGIWSLFQINKEIQFDYTSFASSRLMMYQECKSIL